MNNNKNLTEVKGQENKTETREQENFTTEIFHEFKVHSRIAIIGMVILLAIGVCLYYKNDVDWRELFNSYDYVTQDGSGYNNVNTGEQGDVNNGTESEDKEK